LKYDINTLSLVLEEIMSYLWIVR